MPPSHIHRGFYPIPSQPYHMKYKKMEGSSKVSAPSSEFENYSIEWQKRYLFLPKLSWKTQRKKDASDFFLVLNVEMKSLPGKRRKTLEKIQRHFRDSYHSEKTLPQLSDLGNFATEKKEANVFVKLSMGKPKSTSEARTVCIPETLKDCLKYSELFKRHSS